VALRDLEQQDILQRYRKHVLFGLTTSRELSNHIYRVGTSKPTSSFCLRYFAACLQVINYLQLFVIFAKLI